MDKMRLFLFFLVFSLFSFASLWGQNDAVTLWTARWSPDGQWVAIGGNDSLLRVYDAESWQEVKRYPLQGDIMRLAWHPQHSSLLAVGTTGLGPCLIHIENDSLFSLPGITEGVRCIDWNHDGSLLAGGDGEGYLLIWKQDGSLLKTIPKEHTTSYVALAWHPQRDSLLATSRVVRMYGLNGSLLFKTKHRQEEVLMLSVAWHPSGESFALGDYGNPDAPHPPLLQYWDQAGSLKKEILGHQAEIRNLRWSPKGKKLATASDGLRIWNKKGKLIAQASTRDLLWGIDWSPDGKYLITSSEQGNIYLWDAKARLIKTFR
jgi:WD40 repeat protein